MQKLGDATNHLARRSLASADALWLDCGNHAESGQVICGSSGDRERIETALHKLPESGGVISVLPNASLVFPELLQPEERPTLGADASCADLIEAGQQHLLVNDVIATTAVAYVYRLLYRIPLYAFMSFITLDAVRPMPISKQAIEAYIARETA